LRGELRKRAVRLERGDTALDLRTDRVALAVVDAEGVLVREGVRNLDLPRMLLRLERERRVLRQHRVGTADQHLRDRVVVARIALQVEPDLPLERLQILLVL